MDTRPRMRQLAQMCGVLGRSYTVSVAEDEVQRQLIGTSDALEVEPIIERATEVIGSREKALRWLGTPVRALKFATPISLLDTKEGKDAVLTVLGRLERGVF
jgi:putative toxin-antitoxin system antitoxin component (TIGR02293 family)